MSTFDSFEIEVNDEEKGLYKLNIDPEKKPRGQKFLSGWLKYGEKIILFIGILLIAGISFQAGVLKGQKNQNKAVAVNQPASPAVAPCPEAKGNENADNAAGNSQPNNQINSEKQNPSDNQKCAFVASKSSNKYHLPTCQFAQKIKPENKVCFSSKEEAGSRGYQGAKCCIK